MIFIVKVHTVKIIVFIIFENVKWSQLLSVSSIGIVSINQRDHMIMVRFGYFYGRIR